MENLRSLSDGFPRRGKRFLGKECVEFNLFRSFYEQYADVRQSGAINLVQKGVSEIVFVEIVGPFLFSRSRDDSLQAWYYLPDYVIRKDCKDFIVELIPFNSVLCQKVAFKFDDEIRQLKWYDILLYSNKLIRDLPVTLPEFPMELQIYSSQTQDLSYGNIIVMGDEIQVQRENGSLYCSMPHSVDLKITTTSDTLNFPTKWKLFSFCLWGDDGRGHCFVQKDFDRICCVFLTIAIRIRKIRQCITAIPRGCHFASPFPVDDLKLVIESPIQFVQRPIAASAKDEFKLYEVKFNDHIGVPKEASRELQLVRMNCPYKRSIIVARDPEQRILIRPPEDFTMVGSYDFMRVIPEPMGSDEFSMDGLHEDKAFTFTNQHDEAWFGLTGQQLYTRTICKEYYEVDDKINVKFPENDLKMVKLSHTLDRMLSDLGPVVDCSSRAFREIIGMLAGILSHETVAKSFPSQLEMLAASDPVLQPLFPLSGGNVVSVFVYRVFIKNKMKVLLSDIIELEDWRSMAYSSVSVMRSVKFLSDLILIIPDFGCTKFTGTLNPVKMIAFDGIRLRFDLAIEQKCNEIVNMYRKGISESRIEGCMNELVGHIVDFIESGMMMNVDTWKLITLATRQNDPEDAVDALKYTVRTIDKGESHELLVDICLRKGLRDGYLLDWILMFARAAIDSRTHAGNSLLCTRKSCMTVYRSLKTLKACLCQVTTMPLDL